MTNDVVASSIASLAQFHGSPMTRRLAARPLVLRTVLVVVGMGLVVAGVQGLRFRVRSRLSRDLVPRVTVWLGCIAGGLFLLALAGFLVYVDVSGIRAI